MSAHEFSIPISDLDAAGKQFRFPVRASWVRGALEDHEATAAGEDGELDVRVSKSGNDVVVHGTLKADLTVPCARCLEPVKIPIRETVSFLMVPKSFLKGQEGEYEFAAEEADLVPYEGDTIVLDDMIRDELVLDTPMIPLCSEDCPGISPPPDAASPAAAASSDPKTGQTTGQTKGQTTGQTTGTSDGSAPVDPRLAPLLRFKKTQEKKE
jgi:uncharacterized protein